MLKPLLSLLFVLHCNFAYAEDTLQDESDRSVQEMVEEDLYLSYEHFPSKIYKNQIFSVTVKVLNTNKNYTELWREFGTFDGMRVIQNFPETDQVDYTSYDTYYFQATKDVVRTPDLLYKLLRDDGIEYQPARVKGKNFATVELQSDEYFCNVLAEEFSVKSYKTTAYDTTNNIIVFSVEAKGANIEDFNITQATIQGFESFKYVLPDAFMTYYAVIPKHIRKLEFNYFDLKKSAYIPVIINIEVDDDTVSTQMDLAPTQYTHTYAKIMIAATLIIIGLVLFIIKRQKRYFFIIALTPILYVAWVYFPKERLCVKPDAKIYLLPMENSTVFKKSYGTQHLQKLGKVDDYSKVLLRNSNIGWIKDEDICKD